MSDKTPTNSGRRKRHCIPTGDTPGKPSEKVPSTTEGKTRRSLFNLQSTNKSWSNVEDAALVQYICLFWEAAGTDKFPQTKNSDFWNGCAQAVGKVSCNSRSGLACRSRSQKLEKLYITLSEAEEKLYIDYVNGGPTEAGCKAASDSISDAAKDFVEVFKAKMSVSQKRRLLNDLFEIYVNDVGGIPLLNFVKSDFLNLSIAAMELLLQSGKHNLLYDLAKCFNKVDNQRVSRMPLDRMPFGLIDYNIRFYAADNILRLGCEQHYIDWQASMFAQFGHKWVCLHRGPAWQYEEHGEAEECDKGKDVGVDKNEEGRDGEADLNVNQVDAQSVEVVDDDNEVDCQVGNDASSFDILETALKESGIDLCLGEEERLVPEVHEATTAVSQLWSSVTDADAREIVEGQASPDEMEKFHQIQPTGGVQRNRNPAIGKSLKSKMNVAGFGVRQIQKHIASSGFTRTVHIQKEALKKAKASNPGGRWWIKADACDVRKGLRESMRGVWAGDADLGDGAIQILYSQYKARCSFVQQLGKKATSSAMQADLLVLQEELEKDLEFLEKGRKEAEKEYDMELTWDLIGFEGLIKLAKKYKGRVASYLDAGASGSKTSPLVSLRIDVLKYLRELFTKKRSAASHLLVFMISDELRNRKPYAIPVRFMCYRSITDARLRELRVELEQELKSYGMITVGFTTDGEFNSLRTMGKERPISVLELTKNAKGEARKLKAATIAGYLKLDRFGNPVRQHPAIPLEDVRWLDDFMKNGGDEPISFLSGLLVLRRKLFPFMHDPYPWVEGRDETCSEIIRSLLAIYIYRYQIQQLKDHDDPAHFSRYLYQPERDKDTKELVHDREDHNHLFKRITNCLREGVIPGIDLRFFKLALHDADTGLTYEALTGKNKQSVPDCERIISPGVISFLRSKGDDCGADVIERIWNWHRAVDGRGLSEELRSQYCKEMKYWLLDDWMPWHRVNCDYSFIDVNRPIKGICGLTRELVVGLIANLESRELRRCEYVQRNLPPEHPRASSTDDVEGLIALLHEVLGPQFDLKQFFDEMPKILNEFKKRIDPELAFFYWTGAKERYTADELPSFNQPSGPGILERLDIVQPSRRGDPGVFVANRATLPQWGTVTVRTTFHKAPVELPPVMVRTE